MKRQEDQQDWAQQVPDVSHQGPYRDYGWERHQSALPEFRDPTIHFTPYEYQELQPWQQFHDRQIIYPENLMRRERLSHFGPYTGRGPRSYRRSDESLYEQVCERMKEHGALDASNIKVEVKNGEVTLTGSVPDRKAKRLATDISDSVYGVRDVHNNLQLQGNTGTAQRWRDEVGGSGVYPASEIGKAPRDSETQGMASWGQGERGAKGYDDHGDSELHLDRDE